MLDVSSIYCGADQDGDELRYGSSTTQCTRPGADGSSRKPVVVFNLTRDCNLRCVHCYSGSDRRHYPGQLRTETIFSVLEDLAQFQVPAVLFSGGEPLVHPHVRRILARADELELRTTLSTNGTLIDRETADFLHRTDLRYVGISLDGIGGTNNRFRGSDNAFERAVRGIRNCRAAGQKVGLRMTLTAHNHDQLPAVFDLIDREGINRVCFYHLAYAGRGRSLRESDLNDRQRRRALPTIFRRTREFHEGGRPVEVLTVANPVDNAFLYKIVRRENPDRAGRVYERLRWNGGGLNSAGVGIASIDFYGRVHPNQFWMDRTLGNVKRRPFSEIWTDESNDFLRKLRSRKDRLESPCSGCRLLEVCGGGLRLRAEAEGSLWGRDPACYLTDREREDLDHLRGLELDESTGDDPISG